MRIGIDARLYSTRYTGIGRYVKELVDNILETDQENEYILFFNDPEYSSYLPPNSRVSKRRVKAPHYSLSEQTSFVGDLNREELDLVHFTHFNMPLLYKRPSVVTIHDLSISKFPELMARQGVLQRMGYTMTIKNAVKTARAVICISENTKEDAIHMLGADVKRIHVIYEGVAEEFAPVTDEGKLTDLKRRLKIEKPFILYTGNFRAHKNLVTLVKAFNLLRNRYQNESQLVLAGDPSQATPELADTIHSLGLDAYVLQPGYVAEEDLPALYSAARVFAFPSLYEGFGLPPLEAMACGTPVVAANASCLPEVLGDAALYFAPQDPDELAAQLAKVVTEDSVHDDFRARGFNRVKRYSWKKMAQEILAVYKEAGAGIVPPPPAQPTPAAPPASPAAENEAAPT
jgi:glycosyltransferase involved in cell wall biosynthesis